MNRDELAKILPHRDTMLLLDGAWVQDGEATGKYTVKGSEPFLNGHYPDNPIVPGVILCEIIAQTCCVLALSQDKFKGSTPYLAGMDKVRFKRKVRPGDVIDIKCSIARTVGNVGFAKGEAYVDGEIAVTSEISFAVE